MAKRAASVTTDRPGNAPARPSRTVLDDDALALGTRIRERRRALGLSLVRLAAMTDLSHPFLSQVERGHARPSVTSLQRIAAALGVDAGWLFAAEGDRRAVEVVAGNSPSPLRLAGGQPEGMVRRVAAPGWGASVDDIVELPAQFGERSVSDGDLLCYVVDGAAEVEVDGRLHRLGTHDAVFIAGTVTYGLRATDGVPARVLAIRVGPGLAPLPTP